MSDVPHLAPSSSDVAPSNLYNVMKTVEASIGFIYGIVVIVNFEWLIINAVNFFSLLEVYANERSPVIYWGCVICGFKGLKKNITAKLEKSNFLIILMKHYR